RELLVALAGRRGAHEVLVPGVHLVQVGVAAGGTWAPVECPASTTGPGATSASQRATVSASGPSVAAHAGPSGSPYPGTSSTRAGPQRAQRSAVDSR
ncbi:hypothetical protein AB0N19_28265, partial [Streptomyces sp. NPDC051132]|uniref:hypothetical protein n=1 Tax=Streptomyces sp. NPDC051132 TaxID=3155667 RepID=UPI00343428E9